MVLKHVTYDSWSESYILVLIKNDSHVSSDFFFIKNFEKIHNFSKIFQFLSFIFNISTFFGFWLQMNVLLHAPSHLTLTCVSNYTFLYLHHWRKLFILDYTFSGNFSRGFFFDIWVSNYTFLFIKFWCRFLTWKSTFEDSFLRKIFWQYLLWRLGVK